VNVLGRIIVEFDELALPRLIEDTGVSSYGITSREWKFSALDASSMGGTIIYIPGVSLRKFIEQMDEDKDLKGKI
jgi:hypothetical protein